MMNFFLNLVQRQQYMYKAKKKTGDHQIVLILEQTWTVIFEKPYYLGNKFAQLFKKPVLKILYFSNGDQKSYSIYENMYYQGMCTITYIVITYILLFKLQVWWNSIKSVSHQN